MVAWHRAGVSGAVSGMAISVFNVALAVLREPRARARSMRPTFTCREPVERGDLLTRLIDGA
jgi:hypothetical protein